MGGATCAWDQERRLWELRHDAGDFEDARRMMDRCASLLAEWALIGDRLVGDIGDIASLRWLRR